MDAGTVRIVASEGFVDGLLDQVVAPFCAAHPRLSVVLDALPASELIAEVVSDAAHIGLAYNPQSDAQSAVRRQRGGARQAAGARGPSLAAHAARTRAAADTADRRYPLGLMPPGYGVGTARRTAGICGARDPAAHA
jgi:DNA-binding transcriptional LysR family regulator